MFWDTYLGNFFLLQSDLWNSILSFHVVYIFFSNSRPLKSYICCNGSCIFYLLWSQLYLIELLGLWTGLGLLKLLHLIYSRLLTGFSVLVFITNWSLTEFQVRYLALFLLFSIMVTSSGSGWKVFTGISS